MKHNHMNKNIKIFIILLILPLYSIASNEVPCIACLDTLLPSYGDTIDLHGLNVKGKLLLIQFWSPELKGADDLLQDFGVISGLYKKDGLISIILVKRGPVPKENFKFTALFDTVLTKSFYADKDPRLLPVYILDPEGRVLFREPFPVPMSILCQVIEKNLYGKVQRKKGTFLRKVLN